jgi:hypothetical protein
MARRSLLIDRAFGGGSAKAGMLRTRGTARNRRELRETRARGAAVVRNLLFGRRCGPASYLLEDDFLSAAGIPDDVKAFIAEYVDSAEQLETLLLLHSRPGELWDAVAVARAIYTVPQSASRRLESLTELGLARSDGGAAPRYRYAPREPELEARVKALAAIYRERRVAVINQIYSAPPGAVRSFADAFKLRKD